jgi:hypothetical protein
MSFIRKLFRALTPKPKGFDVVILDFRKRAGIGR